MTAWLTELDSRVSASALAGFMMVAWIMAVQLGRRREASEKESGDKFGDAILALMGLLLAFTFSMSLAKHEQRRVMSVTDSNAIGDFYTTASMLDEPTRSELQAVVKRYVEHRLALTRTVDDEAGLLAQLEPIQAMHGEMQTLVKAGIDQHTPVVVPLVNTLNGLTSSHAARLSAVRDRLPASIVLLLGFSAVLSMALLGWQQGTAQRFRPGGMLGFSAVVSMVFWITLDLNQPEQGWITVSQEPMMQLLKGMTAQNDTRPGTPRSPDGELD